MISPCVHILRQISNSMHSLLGSYPGSKHKAPSMQADLRVLMDSLAQHHVYQLVEGRTFEGDDNPVKDTITTGLGTLKSARINLLINN